MLSVPSGLSLASVYIPHMYSEGINTGSGWAGGFKWTGGSDGVSSFNDDLTWTSHQTKQSRFTWPSGGTRQFGWMSYAASECARTAAISG